MPMKKKMEVFSNEFKKIHKADELFQIAFSGNDDAWRIIMNLMNGDFLVDLDPLV